MDEDLNNLTKKLRDEYTFVHSEKKHLIDLYTQLVKKSEKLFNKQWLIARQHCILDDLIFGRNKATPNQVCTKFSSITNKHQFIESYKILGHNDYYVGEFLKALREKPQYLAQLIVKSEKYISMTSLNGIECQYYSAQHLIPIVFQSLYGNCILIQDEYYCLQLLKHLIEIQFSQSSETTANLFLNNEGFNPSIDLRRLIRKQSCSFNILFKLYTSFSYSAQLYLITALYEPISQILTDEWFLDIDPDKALARFSNEELINKFGHPNSKEYKTKTQKYREKIVNLLYSNTILFIESINSSLYSFPTSLTWLVNQLFKLVSKNNPKTSQPDIARKLCCDLIMALYICPAICDPEPYGVISDVQVSNVARHNLMQVANILQVLAMSDDDKDPKAQDLYSKFRNNCVSDILNNIISMPKSNRSGGSNSNETQLLSQSQLDLYSNEISSNLSTTSSVTNSSLNSQSLIFRTSVMISIQDLHRLIIYLRQVSKELVTSDTEEYKWLKSIMPFDYINQVLENTVSNLNSQKNKSNNSNNQMSLHIYSTESKEVINFLLREPSSEEVYQILVLNISDKGFECPGMLAEEKVVTEYESSRAIENKLIGNKKNSKYSRKDKRHRQNYKSNLPEDNDDNLDNSYEPSIKLQSETGVDRDDIRSRHDGSVGISISSNDEEDIEDNVNRNQMNDLEDDDVNQLDADGLSDFDNFSGRDTPIISGRDTPSSHSHEDLQNISSSRAGSNINNSSQNISQVNSMGNMSNIVNNNPISSSMNPSRGPQLPITVQKANREDINDKFCKFEINKTNPVKEEQLSETGWSLDADPPESVNNDPINDRLGIEENNTSRFNLNANRLANSYSFNTSSLSGTNNNQNNSNQQNTLRNNWNEQEFLLNQNTSQQSNTPASVTSQINTANNIESSDQNLLDDRYSVVSDSAAWSTDLITNSDSDFESNSPSKYTPYSTYSSNCSSSTHPPLNQSLISQLASSSNQTQSNQYSNQNNQNSSILPSSNSFLTSSASTAAFNSDSNKRSDSGFNSENQSTLHHVPSTSSLTNKNKFSSIFSNTNSVKFSLSSTLNNISNSSSQNKKSGLNRIFNFNKSSNTSPKSSTNDPFASLNPFATTNNPVNATNSAQNENQSDTNNVDNILGKYKSNPASQPASAGAQLIDISVPPSPQTDQQVSLTKNFSTNSLQQQQQQTQPNFFDSTNLEQSRAFLDAKKKLRIVLSWPDCLTYNFLPNSHLKAGKENFLVMYLKVQLYDSISLQDKEKEAQLYETIRCVSVFNEQECYKLLRSLKKDYTRRVCYLTYLTKTKQSILYSLNIIDKLLQRAEWHQKLRTHHFASVVTRLFLETKENENQMYKFIHDFRQLVAVDEKFDLFKKFLQLLKKDYDNIWSGCQEEMIQLGHLCLERLLLSKVYSYVMYPNGDIDHYRDSKVSECFNDLANVITPSHPLIGISPIYINECPWTAAQMELRRLNIYRTPQDKLACIRKCMIIIQNLLAIAKSPVCADDLHPVLIYVIIKANPPTFLSNVQYIEGFYGKQLELEDYYWAQFIFAFSYIKANMLGNKVSTTNA